MDPANVIGIIGVVGQIIKTIYKYGDGVLECKSEVARLRAELFGIQAALTQIERDLDSTSEGGLGPLASTNLKSEESFRVLEEARALLVPLAKTLAEGISRTDRLAKRLVWPLKRQHVQDITSHLERFKTYFILAATTDTLQATRETAESLRRLHVSIEGLQISEQQKHYETEAYRWLDPYDPSPTHNAALSAHTEGTGGWFLDGALSDFLLGDSRVLWLTGAPGSGKTCMMAASVDSMEKMPQTGPVTYFYCSSNHSLTQEPGSIVVSLIGQLFHHDTTARRRIIDFCKSHRAPGSGGLSNLELSGLIRLIQSVCVEISKTIFFFVDAIDECAAEAENVIRTLAKLAGRISNAKLVISSTEAVAQLIRQGFPSFGLNIKEVEILQEDVTIDINTYIETRFKDESRLSKLRPQVQSQVKEDLRMLHYGSFRWVQCTVDDLVRLTTPRAIKEALRGITPSLSDNYTAILVAIPEDMAEIAHSILLYLSSAHIMGLTLEQLAEAAAFSSVDDFCEDDRLIEPEIILHHLRSLVRYDPFTLKVELAHSSVRNFLTSPELSGKYHIDPAAAKVAMSRTCVEYLAIPAFRQYCRSDEALERRKEDWPLFSYASQYWSRYVRELGPLPDEISRSLSTFMGSADYPNGGNWASWYQCVFPRGDPDIWKTRPLYTCAREGLIYPLQDILKTSDTWELEQRGGHYGSTALHVAAYYGHVEVVKLLLAAGADPNERNDLGESGAGWAAVKGYRDIVQALQAKGADLELAEHPHYSGGF